MKKKWHFIVLSLFGISLLASCQKSVRPVVIPRYHFTKNKTLRYHLKLETDASANLAIFQYNGKIGIDTDVELKMLRDNTPYGMEVQMLMRNLKVNTGEPRLRAGLIIAMNFVRTYFSKLYITPAGKLNVLYHGKPNFSLTSYAAMLFPDFSDENGLTRGNTLLTNFEVAFGNNKYIAIFENDKGAAIFNTHKLSLPSDISIKLFDFKDYQKSVDPVAIGTVTISLETLFDVLSGEIKSENGNISIHMQYQMKQGFLSYNLSLSATGTVNIEKIEEPQS